MIGKDYNDEPKHEYEVTLSIPVEAISPHDAARIAVYDLSGDPTAWAYRVNDQVIDMQKPSDVAEIERLQAFVDSSS